MLKHYYWVLVILSLFACTREKIFVDQINDTAFEFKTKFDTNIEVEELIPIAEGKYYLNCKDTILFFNGETMEEVNLPSSFRYKYNVFFFGSDTIFLHCGVSGSSYNPVFISANRGSSWNKVFDHKEYIYYFSPEEYFDDWYSLEANMPSHHDINEYNVKFYRDNKVVLSHKTDINTGVVILDYTGKIKEIYNSSSWGGFQENIEYFNSGSGLITAFDYSAGSLYYAYEFYGDARFFDGKKNFEIEKFPDKRFYLDEPFLSISAFQEKVVAVGPSGVITKTNGDWRPLINVDHNEVRLDFYRVKFINERRAVFINNQNEIYEANIY